MDSLITIIERDGKRAVSARDLYGVLKLNPKHWAKWHSRNISNNDFAVHNEDYTELPQRGRSKDFALTIKFAKKLAMMARTEEGEKIRDYFIEVEKQSQQKIKPISPAQQLLQNAQLLVAQERKLSEHESRLKLLEAKTTGNPDLFTIAGYGNLNNISVNLKIAAKLGRAASKICRNKGLLTDTIADPRFGKVRMYPTKVLEHVFDTVTF